MEYRNAKIDAHRKAAKYAPGAHVGKVVVHHDGVRPAAAAMQAK